MKLHEVLAHHEFDNSPIDYNNKNQVVGIFKKKLKTIDHVMTIKQERLMRAIAHQNAELITKLSAEIQQLKMQRTIKFNLMRDVQSGHTDVEHLKQQLGESK